MTYGTREIQDRVPQGNSIGVQLAAGPDGRVNGSYEFFGNANSCIQFSNSDGGVLDVRYSITMLCWVYYDGQPGPFFVYSSGNMFSQFGMFFGISIYSLDFLFSDRDYSSFYSSQTNGSSILAGGWKIVGASYNGATGEVKQWIDGVAVKTTSVTAGTDLATKGNVFMGAFNSLNFKGRITQMRLYNIALSQEQVREIMGKSPLQILQLQIIGNT